MIVNWKDKTNPDILIEKLNIMRLKNPAGEYYFGGFDYLNHFDLLFGLINFPGIIPEYDARDILHQVLHTLVKQDRIKKNELVAEVNKKSNLYLQNPSKRYALFTSLSVDNMAQIKSSLSSAFSAAS